MAPSHIMLRSQLRLNAGSLFLSELLFRLLVRNTAAWPQVEKEKVFPGDGNPVCFTCKSFYTSASRLMLLPTAHLGLDDPPKPDAELTNALKVPAIRINVVKYASLVRGDRSCQKIGLLVDV